MDTPEKVNPSDIFPPLPYRLAWKRKEYFGFPRNLLGQLLSEIAELVVSIIVSLIILNFSPDLDPVSEP